MIKWRLVIVCAGTLLIDPALAQRFLEDPESLDVPSSPAAQEFALVCLTNRTEYNVPFRVRWDAEGERWQNYKLLPGNFRWFYWRYGKGERRSPDFRIVFYSSPGSKSQTTGQDLKRWRSTRAKCEDKCCEDAYRYGFLLRKGMILLADESE